VTRAWLFDPAGWFLFEAGSRPGGRLPFLDSPRKVRPKKATRMPATLRFAAGNLRRGACGVCRRTRCALRAPLRQLRQVRSRSKPVLRQACNPATATPQALTYGKWVRAFASLGPIEKQPSAAMARRLFAFLVVGILEPGCPRLPPFCPRLRWAGCGVASLPKDRPASSSDLPLLFERIAPQAQGVCSAAHPASRPTQVARSEAKGRGQCGARFFAYFLVAGTPVAR
jgi:hypothetical protein